MDNLPIFVTIGVVIISILLFLVQSRATRRLQSELAESRGKQTALQDELKASVQECNKLGNDLTGRAASEAALISVRDEIDRRLTDAGEKLEAERKETSRLGIELATTTETLTKERSGYEDRIRELREARAEMTKEFKLLADEVMRRHGEDFSKTHRESLDLLLVPLKDHIGKFETELRQTHTDAAKEREGLAAHIRQLTEQSTEMSKETLNLTRALKGDVKQQGAWGEMVLATLFERSGLRVDEEYTLQEHHRTEEGHGRRPDAIVNLPENRRLVIDSKVSLKAYEQSIDAETEDARNALLKLHVQSMRTHIKALSDKSYHQIDDAMLDYVIMFVPIEAALAAASSADSDLTSFALENNVVIATPTTLMIVLRTVENVWLVERRNRNALQIAARAGKLYDKVEGFVGDLSKVGEQLGRAQTSYDAAFAKLSTGRGNVLSQIEKLKLLGAKASKSLPTELLDEDPDEAPTALPEGGSDDTIGTADD